MRETGTRRPRLDWLWSWRPSRRERIIWMIRPNTAPTTAQIAAAIFSFLESIAIDNVPNLTLITVMGSATL